MKKCTLTFNMWLHSCDNECPAMDTIYMDYSKCETCKWYKEI